MLHPVGPQSPGVYWFRRIMVVVVLVALLLGVRWLLTGRGGDGSSSAAGPTTSPSASPTTSPSTTPKPSSSATTKPSSSPTTKPSTSAGVSECKDSAIAVTASTDAASYAVGSTPRLRMRIQNTSDTACKRDVGAAMNELLITSGSARVWSSDDCNTAGTQQVATLQPGQSYSVSVTWLGRLSAKGCPADQPLAQKGSYKLTGRNGEIVSQPAVFALT
jgi:cytoskeletal protein RodZ